MTRALRRTFVTLLVAVALLGLFAQSALAALVPTATVDLPEGVTGGTSMTNPNAPDAVDTWWRQGWGNSLYPEFTLNRPSDGATSTGLVSGMLYSVTTAPTDIDIAQPGDYFRAARGTGTNLDQTIDLMGVFNYPPPGGWRAAPEPGAVNLLEGHWWFNLVWFTSMGYVTPSIQTHHLLVGLDMTPPSMVDSMVVSPSLNPADATETFPTRRINISWKPKDYDTLSGDAYYQILVDGVPAVPDSPSNPPQGRVYNLVGDDPIADPQPGLLASSVTIESLTAGRHVIGVAAVDRATNQGPVATKVVFVDPDTPTITITKPSGSLIGVKPTVAATAADEGGIVSVVFALDGAVISTYTSAPYSGQVDLSGFAAGPHTLTATATDRAHRTATYTKIVTLDRTPLVISSFSRSASLFYPIKRDRYKDNLTIKYRANKECAAQLQISKSSGAVVRTISKNAAAGVLNSVVWDGKWSDGKARTGTFYLQVVASDSAGNTYATSKLKTVIRNYQIKKIAHNKVRVISR